MIENCIRPGPDCFRCPLPGPFLPPTSRPLLTGPERSTGRAGAAPRASGGLASLPPGEAQAGWRGPFPFPPGGDWVIFMRSLHRQGEPIPGGRPSLFQVGGGSWVRPLLLQPISAPAWGWVARCSRALAGGCGLGAQDACPACRPPWQRVLAVNLRFTFWFSWYPSDPTAPS